jgi:MFS family permease
MIGAGLSGAALAARWGRRLLFWGGAAGMAVGALLLLLGRQPAATLAAVLVMGYLGTLLLIMVQATLADHHGVHRATALTEANIFAILCAGLAPILLGFFQGTPLTWRAALLLPVAAFGLLAFFNWRIQIPQPLAAQHAHADGHLPRLFWAFWVVLLLSVALEWSVVGWGTDFLASTVGFSPASAAALFSLFFFGAVLGRFANSRWTQHVPARKLLLMMLFVVAASFPFFWLAQSQWLNLLGLVVVGFGIGSLFPLGLGAALDIAEGQSDAASSRVSMGTGLAMLLVPFTLGWVADVYDLRSAFGIVAVVLFAAIAMTVVTNRAVAAEQ